MKKFSKILEDLENSNFYIVDVKMQLIIPAENEGEAGYMSDSILSSIKYCKDYRIELIDETVERISDSYGFSLGDQDNKDYTEQEKIRLTWEANFGDRTPTTTEKMEFYHDMRMMGIDGIVISDFIKSKL